MIRVSKQTTLLDGVDVRPPKQSVCWRGLNRYVHEAMNSISNVKVHFKTQSGNVNIGKCSKISNTFLSLFSNEMLVIRAGIHKMSVRIANRKEPDQTASSEEWVCTVSLGLFGR